MGLCAVGVVALARPWGADGIDGTEATWMLLGSASLGLSFGYTRRFISPLGIPEAAAATYQMLIAARSGSSCSPAWTASPPSPRISWPSPAPPSA